MPAASAQPTRPGAPPVVPTYLTSCPSCGAPLQPVVGDPQSAPWLCGPAGCSQAFWPSELSDLARRLYRSIYRDFGHGPDGRSVATLRNNDLVNALERGTSALPEHLPLLPLVALKQLTARGTLSASFQATVAQAITVKGG